MAFQEVSCSVLRINTNDALTFCTFSFYNVRSNAEALHRKLEFALNT
jgi:hypothetical protein